MLIGAQACASVIPTRRACPPTAGEADRLGLAQPRSQTEVAVDVAARPDHSDRNHLLVVIRGVDDPVITDPDPQPRPVTLQRASTCGPGIIGECAHRG